MPTGPPLPHTLCVSTPGVSPQENDAVRSGSIAQKLGASPVVGVTFFRPQGTSPCRWPRSWGTTGYGGYVLICYFLVLSTPDSANPITSWHGYCDVIMSLGRCRWSKWYRWVRVQPQWIGMLVQEWYGNAAKSFRRLSNIHSLILFSRMFMYTYTHTYCIYIYTYINTQREREIYIFIYIYIYTHTHRFLTHQGPSWNCKATRWVPGVEKPPYSAQKLCQTRLRRQKNSVHQDAGSTSSRNIHGH